MSQSNFKPKFKIWLSQYGYAIVFALIFMGLNCFIYFVTPFIARNFKIYDFTIHGFDDKVPLIRLFFIPYLLSYPFWIIAPIIAGKNKERMCNWMIAVFISYAIVAIIYCFVPTTIIRPIDEMLASESAVDRLIGKFYNLDGGYDPLGCFPSLHCLLSSFCYIAVRNQKNIHIANRIGILTMDILILLSTQFTKQHYIVDLIASVVLSETTFFICNKFNLGKRLFKTIEKIENKFINKPNQSEANK